MNLLIENRFILTKFVAIGFIFIRFTRLDLGDTSDHLGTKTNARIVDCEYQILGNKARLSNRGLLEMDYFWFGLIT